MDYDKILQGILDVGEEMVICGAEVNRVEDSIFRMCAGYKAERINVFIITSNIQVTMEAPDGRILTHIRRITRNDVNFDRLDYLNDLSRYISENQPTEMEIGERLKKVLERKPQPIFLKYIGAALVAGCFTVFFGGSLKDGLSACIMGVLIVLMENILASREANQIVYNFIVSTIAGFGAIGLVEAGIGDNSGIIMMGGIMLLIPGIAMTNAVRDMLTGDIAAGLLRLSNSILIAAAIACGFAISIYFTGGII